MVVLFRAASTASAGKIGLRGPDPRNDAAKSIGTGTLRSPVRCAMRSCDLLAASRLALDRGSKNSTTSSSNVFTGLDAVS